jgi:hypothetical protein
MRPCTRALIREIAVHAAPGLEALIPSSQSSVKTDVFPSRGVENHCDTIPNEAVAKQLYHRRYASLAIMQTREDLRNKNAQGLAR